MAQLSLVARLVLKRPSTSAAGFVRINVSGLRHCVASLTTATSSPSIADIKDDDGKKPPSDNSSLTPHQRMALALREKRQKSKRLQMLQGTSGASRDILAALKEAKDPSAVKYLLRRVEQNTDFSAWSTPQIQSFLDALVSEGFEFTGVAHQVCLVLENRLKVNSEVNKAVTTLNLIARHDRLPYSTLKALDETACTPGGEPLSIQSISTLANIFSSAKDYARTDQVMEHLALKADKHDLSLSVVGSILRGFVPTYVHCLPRSFILKLEKFVESNFDSLIEQRPSGSVLALRTLAARGSLSQSLLDCVMGAIDAEADKTGEIKENMLRIISIFHLRIDRERVCKVLPRVKNLNQKNLMFVVSIMEIVTAYSIKLPASLAQDMDDYITTNSSEFMDHHLARKALLAYLSNVQELGTYSGRFDVCERTLNDVHSLTASNSVQMAAVFVRLPNVQNASLLRFLNHLTIRLDDEGGLKRLSASDVAALFNAVELSRMHIPRLMHLFCSHVDAVAAKLVSAKPADLALKFLGVMSRCGFLDDSRALAAAEKVENMLSYKAVSALTPHSLVKLTWLFTVAHRYPDDVLDAFHDLILTRSQYLSDSSETKYRLIHTISHLQARNDKRVLDVPLQLIEHLTKVMIFRMCHLLSNSRSATLASIVYELNISEDLMLTDIVSGKGYVVNVALLVNCFGQLCSWKGMDFVSKLDIPSEITASDITPKVVNVELARQKGYSPVGIVGVSNSLGVTNHASLLSGIIRSSVDAATSDGWFVCAVFDNLSRKDKAKLLSESISQCLLPPATGQ